MRPDVNSIMSLVLCCVSTLSLLSQSGRSQELQPANPRVRTLQQQRLHALTRIQTPEMKLFQDARIEVHHVCATNLELLRLHCEVTENRDDLIKSLDQQLIVAVELRNIAQKLLEASRGPGVMVWVTDVLILQIQIEQEKLALKVKSRIADLLQKRKESLTKIHDRLMNYLGTSRIDLYFEHSTNNELLQAIGANSANLKDETVSLEQLMVDAVRMQIAAQSMDEGAHGREVYGSMANALILSIQIAQEKLVLKDGPDVTELRQKRLETLTKIQESTLILYQKNRAYLADANATSLELLEAISANPGKREDQIKSLDRLMKDAVQLRELAQSRVEGRRETEINVMKADALILAIQIEQEKLADSK